MVQEFSGGPNFVSFRWRDTYGNSTGNYASNIAYYHTATEICAKKNWLMSEDKGIFSTLKL